MCEYCNKYVHIVVLQFSREHSQSWVRYVWFSKVVLFLLVVTFLKARVCMYVYMYVCMYVCVGKQVITSLAPSRLDFSDKIAGPFPTHK